MQWSGDNQENLRTTIIIICCHLMQRFVSYRRQVLKENSTMKILLYIVTAFFMMTVFACKKETFKAATVIINCTGTYLRAGGKDYKVCNLEMVSSFPGGTLVEASFKKKAECKGSGNFPVVCYLYHEYEGWIEVEKIK
jgi:hypothetical protein